MKVIEENIFDYTFFFASFQFLTKYLLIDVLKNIKKIHQFVGVKFYLFCQEFIILDRISRNV